MKAVIGQHAKVPHRRQVFIKFILLVLVLLGYLGYLTHIYDFRTGSIAALLTWSFFVLCTPVADAGFLLDLPLRLLFGIRMFVSEVMVWGVAIGLNLIALMWFPHDYETTALTRLLHAIITTPWPYWSVVAISGAGTFLSIRFGDELMDVLHHHQRDHFHRHGFKHELLMLAFAFVISLVAYYEVISSLGIDPVH
ncbi:MAG: hypothetical protein GY947_13895 [Rhodobacteraceae bacterium]|nr:hypothetical protein [Paracoccaceae bacterium]